MRPRSLLTLVATALVVMSLASAPLRAGWALTRIASTGSDGFTRIDSAAIGPAGQVAVRGLRDGQEGIFLIVGSQITTIALVGGDLPGTSEKIRSLDSPLLVDPQGRVGFLAEAPRFFLRGYRSTATGLESVLPGDPFGHRFDNATTDGRWIAEQLGAQLTNSQSHLYRLTDGVNSTEVFSYIETFGGAEEELFGLITPISTGQVYGRRVHTSRTFVDGTPTNPQTTTEIRLLGPGSNQLIVSEQMSAVDNLQTFTRTISGKELLEFVVNDSGTIAYGRRTYAGIRSDISLIEIIRRDALGEQVLMSSAPTVAFRVMAIDPVGRLIISFANSSGAALLGGPDPATDRIVSEGDRVGDHTVSSMTFLEATQPAGAFGDKRVVLFRYRDSTAGVTGIAIASRAVTRWVNSSGGSWNTAANWLPATVPGSATETLFDLEASYDVTVGSATSGRSSVENGSVVFRSADLTLTGPFSVGGDANFSQPEGKITAGELTIGSLPPVNPATPPTARFVLSNDGTTFATTGPTIIGQAGIGDLFINDAKMTSGEVRIGAGSTGTAAVGLTHGFWETGSIAVGYTHSATLSIERGGRVVSRTAVIGLGDALKSDLAVVNMDNRNGHTGLNNQWTIFDALTIGDKLPGQLNLTDGATVGVTGPVKLALNNTPENAQIVDAAIDIDGTGSTNAQRAALFSLVSTHLGVGSNTFADVLVMNGALLHCEGELILGDGVGSLGEFFISGTNTAGLRAELQHNVLADLNAEIQVGGRGEGILLVADGALVTTELIDIGGASGSKGTVWVDGKSGNVAATLKVKTQVTVGGAAPTGSDVGASGELTLANGGTVETKLLLVDKSGTIRGSGTILVDLLADFGGTLAPAVNLTPPLFFPESIRTGATQLGAKRMADSEGGVVRAQADTAPIRPGTITIQGNVVMKPTARVELDVLGSAPDAADRLVVTGALTLGGTLELNFANGYAPKAGDTLDLIGAPTVTGSFATTTITGLEPGFQFTLAPNGAGSVRLTAVNDGVPATAVGSRLSNLSVRTPLAEGQNLIVGFVVQGGAKPVLVRAAGPGLATMIDGTHPDPRITLFDNAGRAVDSNDNWPAELAATMQSLGAFPFAPASTDAALLRGANAAYTAHVNGPGTGIVLVELYDAQTGVSPRLVNASARNRVGTGADILIAGFVIEGSSPKTVLVRGVGPGLQIHGVSDALVDPLLTVFEGGSALAQNDDWPASLADVFATVGAFELPTGSKDAALLVTLAPGIYTAQVSGVGATTGEALVEVYEVP